MEEQTEVTQVPDPATAGIGAVEAFVEMVKEVRKIDAEVAERQLRRESLREMIVAAMQQAKAKVVDVEGVPVSVYTRPGSRTLDKKALLQYIDADKLGGCYKVGREVTVFLAQPAKGRETEQ